MMINMMRAATLASSAPPNLTPGSPSGPCRAMRPKDGAAPCIGLPINTVNALCIAKWMAGSLPGAGAAPGLQAQATALWRSSITSFQQQVRTRPRADQQ
jgi:hypothetical protein